ncbi:MAG: hypothetical protein KVP17_003966 [Porospora cf. gigantea B]|uniref:uncharacterized protein n=1 Tax=Porospora cf. gigantea B TaxID=2853592 RepID=UPI003571F4D0|nr:MAG: hypothetical protein KVP17_003966 [Porospora cf. gigantea B]
MHVCPLPSEIGIIRKVYPTLVPVFLEPRADGPLASVGSEKLLVPPDMTLGEFIHLFGEEIREDYPTLTLPPTDGYFSLSHLFGRRNDLAVSVKHRKNCSWRQSMGSICNDLPKNHPLRIEYG